MEIDIRKENGGEVDSIRFAEVGSGSFKYNAVVIEKDEDSGITFIDKDGDHSGFINSADIDDAIKALQKAKQLGW
jgi:hypothetical protein